MQELLTKLSGLGIQLNSDQNNLEIIDEHDNLTEDLIQEIKAHKADLLKLLSASAITVEEESIPKAESKPYYDLSHAQERMYFLYQMEPASTVYNMPYVAQLTGTIDEEKLVAVFNQLIARHESLRTYFEERDGKPVQRIADEVAFEMGRGSISPEEVTTSIEAFIRPFKLSEGPLMRASLLELTDQQNVLMIDMHHIICDGLSQDILVGDLMKLYNDETPADLTLQYKDFAEWQRNSSQNEQDIAFWMSQFEDEFEVLELPLDYKRTGSNISEGQSVSFEIGAEETTKLRTMAQANGATLYMQFLAIYNVLLARLSNQQDVTIGTPVAGRDHADMDKTMGMFVNTLALRNFPKGQMTYLDFLKELHQNTLTCFDHQHYPFESLVNALGIERESGRNPLFDSMFVFQNQGAKQLQIPGLTVTPYAFERNISTFDLTLTAAEGESNVVLSFEYATALFERSTIDRFIGYFHKVLQAILENPSIKLAEIELLEEQEQTLLLNTFNATKFDFPRDLSVIDLFEQQVVEQPERVAVACQGKTLDYQTLNARANQVASVISEQLNGTGNRVAILCESSVEAVVSILGVLKSGNTYIPLSSSLPAHRIDFILGDAGAALLLTDEHNSGTELSSLSTDKMVNVTALAGTEPTRSYESKKLSAADIIYIIYTSGSTGTPKGVEVRHGGIANMAHFFHKKFNVLPGANMSQVANLSFDAAAFEIFPCLVHGGCLHIVEADMRLDPIQMKDWLVQNEIGITFQPTALAERLLSLPWNESALRVMNIAGDKLTVPAEVTVPFEVFNLYGPTEDSIWTTYKPLGNLSDASSSGNSIGKPTGNKQVLITNEAGMLQPVNVPGELCIAGEGLAKGYLNNEELTNEKFTENKYKPGTLRYRSGDLAKWLPNGEIEFLGRLDHQVKIRGFRIEIGEIENQMVQIPGVQEAVVIAREQANNKILVGYYKASTPVESQDIREALTRQLPYYMVPAHFVALDEIPVTSNGKIDRRALPEPVIESGAIVAPSADALEQILIGIWSEILGIEKEKIGLDESFFALGGQSLMAGTLTNKIAQAYQVEMPIKVIFDHQTIRELAAYLKEQGVSKTDSARETAADKLKSIWSEILGVEKDKIGLDESFFALGGQSLMAGTLTNKIAQEFKVEAPIKVIFDHQTIHQLVNFLEEQGALQDNSELKDTESKLVAIWSEILGIEKDKIGLDDSFFALGGQSLMAGTLTNKITQTFQVEAPIKIIFDHQTVRELAAYLDQQDGLQDDRISKAPEQEYYQVSSAQKRMFFLYEFDQESLSYNIPSAVRVEGALDMDKLNWAFVQLINRHESLRTQIELIDGQIVQRIVTDFEFNIEVQNCNQAEVDDYFKAFSKPFDLSRAPLIRAGVLALENGHYVLMMDMHHIVCDGVSLDLLLKDFMRFYNDETVEPLRIQYKDYAEWQQSAAQQQKVLEQKSFWLEEYAELPEPLDLPSDFVRPSVPDFKGGEFDFELDATLSRQLRTIAASHQSTMFMTLLSIFKVYLSKLSNQEDIVVGTSTAGRGHADLDQLIGMFINTVPIRNKVDSMLSFSDFLGQVTNKALNCFDNQSYQYEDLIEQLNVDRDTARNPLFDVTFDLNNFEEPTLTLPDLTLKPYEPYFDSSQFDLSLTALEANEIIKLKFRYATSLYKAGTIQKFADYFQNVVKEVVQDIDTAISDISLLGENDRNRLLHDFNDSFRNYPKEETFPELFTEAAKQYPERIAIADENETLNYQELDALANRIAAFLRSKQLEKDQIIPVILPRSAKLIACMLGIQKAGYVFVAIDIDHPVARIQGIIEDCLSRLVITNADLGQTLGEAAEALSFEIALIDKNETATKLYADYPSDEVQTTLTADDITYLIYTSGSTGKPKGVLLHQRGMINHFRGLVDLMKLDEEDCLAQTAECSFDIFVVQALLCLMVGGRTQIVSKEVMLDATRFATLIDEQNITVVELVPTVLNYLLESWDFKPEADHMRWLISCGERLTQNLAEAWYTKYPWAKIVNAYGPAEASDDVTAHIVPNRSNVGANHHVPIGKPLPNVKMYILDHNLRLCPVGVKGEICISGVAVGKGYWRNEEQTQKKFVPNPYASEMGPDHGVIYRTGDTGYWQEDQNIVFLGRMDNMVKVRGARIELGEVESVVLKVDTVEQVVVVVKEQQLCSYYVTSSGKEISNIREVLQDLLPEFMMPTHLIHLEAMPLTSNGKIDRKALPDPDLTAGVKYEAPANELEAQLVEIWSNALEISADAISTNSSFFELGGHSLKAVVVLNHINKELGTKLKLKDLFIKDTIQSLARFIELNNWLLADEVGDLEGEELII